MASDALIELLRDSAPERAGGSRLHVAFSGGLDSTVLLHALVEAEFPDLLAVHVHHGLQPAADDWAARCKSVCESLNVPLQVLRVRVDIDGHGLEAAARDARYAALGDGLRPGEVLATAHHRGDQAETVLLNLLRGSGPAGLTGMVANRPFADGSLWRPFLGTSRDRLARYARRHGLQWIEDPHNRDPRFARSFLRQEILPRLTQRWPTVEENLGRTAALMAECATLMRELAEADITMLAEGGDGSLPVAELQSLSAARRNNLIRRWVQRSGLNLPSHEALRHLDRDVLGAVRDAVPVLGWSGGEFRRYRDRLYAMPTLPPVPDDFRVQWDGGSPLTLPQGCGVLEFRGGPSSPSQWTVRMARASDRFRPKSGGRSRTLKNLFQESSVPTWVRERTPLLAIDERPVWVGGFGWSADHGGAATAGQAGLEWRHHLQGTLRSV